MAHRPAAFAPGNVCCKAVADHGRVAFLAAQAFNGVFKHESAWFANDLRLTHRWLW